MCERWILHEVETKGLQILVGLIVVFQQALFILKVLEAFVYGALGVGPCVISLLRFFESLLGSFLLTPLADSVDYNQTFPFQEGVLEEIEFFARVHFG